jgi:hypothetical protein
VTLNRAQRGRGSLAAATATRRRGRTRVEMAIDHKLPHARQERTKKRRPVRPLRDVLQYRNDTIVTRFLEVFDLKRAEANQLFEDALRMLWLYAHAQSTMGVHSMPLISCHTPIDELWHTFMLDSKAYEAFCNEYLGGFVHHEPGRKYRKRKSRAELAEWNKKLDWYVEFVHDQLGEETAVRWFDAYPKRYGMFAGEFLDDHRIPYRVAATRRPPR